MPDDAILNTLEQPGQYDALPKLRRGEPYFTLLGRDACAPPAIIYWAHNRRLRVMAQRDAGEINPEDAKDELRQCTQAEEIAWGMEAYKAGHKEPEPTRENDRYSGHIDSPEQARRDKLQRQRVDTETAMHNAIGEMTALMEIIYNDDEPGRPQEVRCLRETIKTVQACAELIRVKRPGIDK